MSNPEYEKPIFDRRLAASSIANGDSPYIEWSSPPNSHVSLKYFTSEEVPGRYYNLTALTQTKDCVKGKHYIFSADSGELIGVVRNDLDVDPEGDIRNINEVEYSKIFQVEHQFTAPEPDEELELDRFLETGLENPTLREGEIPPEREDN